MHYICSPARGRNRKFNSILVLLLLTFTLFFIRATLRRKALAAITVDGWNHDTSRDANLYVLPDKTTTILFPREFCSKSSSLLVIITSAPDNADTRQTIRDTWGSVRNVSNFHIDVYFLLGVASNSIVQQQIEEEFVIHDDLIQERFIDSYSNLTLKSLMMLKIVETHCLHKTRYLMKVDDDTYLNVPPLVSSLKRNEEHDLLMGHMFPNAFPIRDAASKWYAPYYLYQRTLYPYFLSGTGYVMSIDIVSKLYQAALHTPMYYLEDVYVTGIVAEKIHLKLKDNYGFSHQKRTFDPCVYLTAITSHGHSKKEIAELFSLIQKSDLQALCGAQN